MLLSALFRTKSKRGWPRKYAGIWNRNGKYMNAFVFIALELVYDIVLPKHIICNAATAEGIHNSVIYNDP